MMQLEFYLKDDGATRRLGAAMARLLGPGDVIALTGGLGAGKTTFARGLIQAVCGPDTEVPSPTYTLVQAYDGPLFPLWHMDLYRLETPDEVFELGWDDTAHGAILVEWPDRAGRHLPTYRLDISIQIDGDGRRVSLEPRGEEWQTRLDGFRF